MFVLVTNSHPSITRPLARSYPPGTRTRPRSYSQKKGNYSFATRSWLCSYSFATRTWLCSYSSMDELNKTRTRPWTGTGQVRLRARTSTGSARCRRLPEVELAHELELVRGLTPRGAGARGRARLLARRGSRAQCAAEDRRADACFICQSGGRRCGKMEGPGQRVSDEWNADGSTDLP